MHTPSRIAERLLFGNLDGNGLRRQLITFKQGDNLRGAIILHQRVRQQINGKMLSRILIQRAEKHLQHQHVKTLAQVELNNQRNKLVRRHHQLATSHPRQDFMIPLARRILDGLSIQHNIAFIQRPLHLG